jgi:hypothetical protein
MSYACISMPQVQESKKLRIAFVHPDLGIGERIQCWRKSRAHGFKVELSDW